MTWLTPQTHRAQSQVAALFFKGAKDLQLIELDATRLPDAVQWVVGVMGDKPPSSTTIASAATTVHYLIADGKLIPLTFCR